MIGSQKSLSFQVDIRNDGENAYMTQLELRLPENTFLSKISFSLLLRSLLLTNAIHSFPPKNGF